MPSRSPLQPSETGSGSRRPPARRSWTSRRLLAGCALSIALAGAPATSRPARADPAAQGRFFDRLARARYAEGDYEGALRMFLHALEAAPSPRLRYNAALCAQLAGRLPLSWAAFEEYLAAEDLEPERRAEAQRRMAELSGRLALVDVTTDPPGAMLFLDDRDRGDHGRSPRTLPLARGGAVLVRAELEGHHPAEMRVEVAVGQRRAVHLALAPRMGTLRLRTRPRGAPVLVMRGDRRVAVGGGGDSLELPVGRYRLVTGLEGHEEATADVEVSEGRVEAATLVPRPLPAPSGRLLVDSGHVEAVVEVDGRRVGPTPLALDGVAVGERRVRVRAAGHLPWERTVRVEPDRPAYVNVTLVPAR